MVEKYVVDALTVESVSIKIQHIELVNEVETPVGDIHRKAYINSPKGRIELAADVPETTLDEVLVIWGEEPTVEDLIPMSPTMDELRIAAKIRINSECSTLIVNGFISSLHYGVEKNYIMTAEGQYSKQAQMADLAASLQNGTIAAALWKCADAESEVCEVWTKEEFLQFVYDFGMFKMQAKLKSDILCDRIKLCETSEALDTVSMMSELTEEETAVMQSRAAAMLGVIS